MKKRIHINQHNIRHNKKHGGNKPVITVKTYNDNIKCNGLTIHGSSRLMYQPEKPLSCGARVWIETESEITYEGDQE